MSSSVKGFFEWFVDFEVLHEGTLCSLVLKFLFNRLPISFGY